MTVADQPEYQDIETFAQYLLDEERTSFLPGEAQRVAERMGKNTGEVQRELKSYGFTMDVPTRCKVRGFTTSSNDRYFGPGSEKMHGGSGWVQINGFATQEGY